MGAKILSIFVNIVIYKKFPENYMQNIATHEPSLAYQLLSIFVFCLYKVERTAQSSRKLSFWCLTSTVYIYFAQILNLHFSDPDYYRNTQTTSFLRNAKY